MQGEGLFVFGLDDDSAWLAEGWLGYAGAGGLQLDYHWLHDDKRVWKVFGAMDQNEFDDRKATVGFGVEGEHVFFDGYVSGATTGDRLTGTLVDVDTSVITGSDNVVNWPVHEVGRNPDYFDPKSAVLLKKGSWIFSDSLHTHSSGKDVTSHLEFGYKLAPKGYKPTYKRAVFGLGNLGDMAAQGLSQLARPTQASDTSTAMHQRMTVRLERDAGRPQGEAERRDDARGAVARGPSRQSRSSNMP